MKLDFIWQFPRPKSTVRLPKRWAFKLATALALSRLYAYLSVYGQGIIQKNIRLARAH
jgi:hypothetical protein